MLKYNTVRDIKILTECLQIGCEALRSVGAKFWLSDGALLAIEREGEVFQHDHDFDMGIWGDGQLQEICTAFPPEFKPLGWASEIIYGKQQGYAFQYKSWIFDLRFWYDSGEYLVNAQRYPSEFAWRVGTFYESKKLFINLAEMDYHGVKVPVPNPINEYLVERYGNDWKTFPLTGENRWWIYSKSFKSDNSIWEKIK